MGAAILVWASSAQAYLPVEIVHTEQVRTEPGYPPYAASRARPASAPLSVAPGASAPRPITRPASSPSGMADPVSVFGHPRQEDRQGRSLDV